MPLYITPRFTLSCCTCTREMHVIINTENEERSDKKNGVNPFRTVKLHNSLQNLGGIHHIITYYNMHRISYIVIILLHSIFEELW